MASAMYRPSFSRALNTSNASISSKSSASSSVRAVYTRDSQGYDDLAYPFSKTPADSEALITPKPFTRAVYSKDAREPSRPDINFGASYKFTQQQASTSGVPFKRAAYSKDGCGFSFEDTYKGRQ